MPTNESRRMICWPAATAACLRGECGFCYAGRLLKMDTIRRYAKKQDLEPAYRFGFHNPKVDYK